MMRPALIPLGLALVASAPAIGQTRPVTCARDLLQNQAGMNRQLRLLRDSGTADQAAQCKIWRDHVGFLQQARSVFASCQSGAERERNVAQMDSELGEFRGLLAGRCKR
jgi:hypothetical protein